jgi:hypothetical protein
MRAAPPHYPLTRRPHESTRTKTSSSTNYAYVHINERTHEDLLAACRWVVNE